MSNDTFRVTSEISPFFEKDTQSRPKINDNNVVSKFTFSVPQSYSEKRSAEKDEDGDYVLVRKGQNNLEEYVIYLEHSVSTEICLVALQIWRAALLVADFIIHNQDLFSGKNVLELGAGVGLTTIVAGIFAKKVTCTDLDVGDVLTLIKSNVERNKSIIKAEVCVLGLDFFNREWPLDLQKDIEEADVVIAADVIYDNDVTEAFVETITKILNTKPKKDLYLALEKRYVFTISDLDSVAPCYEHLMSCVREALTKQPFSNFTMTEVSLDFPQYFNYERVRQLVMYKFSS